MLWNVDAILRDLRANFAHKGLGPLHYFFGIEVQRVNDSIHLSHGKYVSNLLSSYQSRNVKLQASYYSIMYVRKIEI